MNCGYVRKFPEVFFWLGIRRDKGASCLQLNPERFYILKGKWGRRGTKEEREGKLEQDRERERKLERERGDRERERKLERERGGEKIKKERRIKAKY